MSEEAARLVQILQGAIETGVGIAEARAALVIHISRIERERDEALEKAELSATRLVSECDRSEQKDKRIAELEAENARLREDAERYRWLRANTEWMYPSSEGSDQKHAYLTVTGYGDCFHDPKAGEIVDAAIDAARKPEGEQP